MRRVLIGALLFCLVWVNPFATLMSLQSGVTDHNIWNSVIAGNIAVMCVLGLILAWRWLFA